MLEALSLSGEGTGYDRLLGITGADLYVPGLNFVFGLAKRRTAVISLHRLRQPFYHLPEDREVFSHRVLVEAVHELGHTYGLSHCSDPACVMYFSQTIADTDRKGPTFCAACHPEIQDGHTPAMMQNLLITGKPGAGKTTLVRRIVEDLSEYRPVGFYTQEVREAGRRVGFELVSLDGRLRVLAHTGIESPHQVGKYGVDVEGFEEFLAAIPFTGREADLIVIDEIGKMEWFSYRFREIVREALDAATPCLATIALHGGREIEALRLRQDVRVVEITRENRGELLPTLGEDLRRMVAAAPERA